jgi:hypothetical protein
VGTVGQVFISYASQDVAVADAVCGALEDDGLNYWIAPRDVVTGGSGGIGRAMTRRSNG